MAEEKHPSPQSPPAKANEVIRIEDLTPREDVKGGRKIVLGEKDDVPEPPPD